MKNVVITGSIRSIGFSMVTEFLQAGCNITLSGRGEAMSEEAQTILSPFEGKYIYVPCNVQEKASMQNLWETGETYTQNIVQTNIIGRYSN